MKFILVLIVVVACIGFWRANRQIAPRRTRQQAQAAPEPLDVVCCAWCSLHVPAGDVVRGKNGAYCSAEHRDRAEH
jgi:uncharacterized protein